MYFRLHIYSMFFKLNQACIFVSVCKIDYNVYDTVPYKGAKCVHEVNALRYVHET